MFKVGLPWVLIERHFFSWKNVRLDPPTKVNKRLFWSGKIVRTIYFWENIFFSIFYFEYQSIFLSTFPGNNKSNCCKRCHDVYNNECALQTRLYSSHELHERARKGLHRNSLFHGRERIRAVTLNCFNCVALFCHTIY